jgi:hypothetical protein
MAAVAVMVLHVGVPATAIIILPLLGRRRFPFAAPTSRIRALLSAAPAP